MSLSPRPPAAAAAPAATGPAFQRPPRRPSYSHIHSSPLVQWLAREAGAKPPRHASLAQGLGPWLGWADAIALSGVLNAPAALPLHALAPTAAASAVAAAQQMRQSLAQAIAEEPAFTDGPDAAPPDMAALRGHLRLHQRAMAGRVAQLRARVRQTLAAHGPAGAELAALDAVFEKAFAAREAQLLAGLPNRLVKAFEQTNGDSRTAGAQARRMLLAELAHRMAPVDGMLAVLRQGHGVQA